MANEGKKEENEVKPEEKMVKPKGPYGTGKTEAMASIREAIAARIAEAVPHIRNNVVTVLTEKEIRRRSDAVLKGLEMEEQQNKEIRKLEKPDQVSYDVDGNVSSSSFSKQRIDEMRKAKERREKIRRALENALKEEEPDFQKLFELVGTGKSGDDSGESSGVLP